MTDSEWLRGIIDSGWNNDEWSPEVKAMLRRVADRLDATPEPSRPAALAWDSSGQFIAFADLEDAFAFVRQSETAEMIRISEWAWHRKGKV